MRRTVNEKLKHYLEPATPLLVLHLLICISSRSQENGGRTNRRHQDATHFRLACSESKIFSSKIFSENPDFFSVTSVCTVIQT